MPKKLLLVDDEETFLEGLKEGLEQLSNVFEIDICFSVNEAIKHIALKPYDIIITDIRMPVKSGIELLIYLKDTRFPGKVMVMSAYSMDESAEKIKSFGVVDVIPKPFDLEWFKRMLLDRFVEEKQRAITFESIDLVTVMQIINLEKKTSVLQIDSNEKKGMICFVNGEIMHAEYESLEGEEALLELVSLNNSIISVIKGKKIVKSTVHTPFIYLIIRITQTIDEMRRYQQVKQKEERLTEKNETQEIDEDIKKVLESLTEVKGYLGGGVFTSQAKYLEKNPKIKGIPIENIGSLIQIPLEEARKMTKVVEFGNIEMMQIYTEKGIIFVACPLDEKYHFHTLLVLQHDGNVAMAMMKLRKVVETLKSVLQ